MKRIPSEQLYGCLLGGVSLTRPPQLLVSKFLPFSIMSAKNRSTAVYEN
jgi:hypothetical protein